jgi:hypothetical protein
MRRRFTVVCEWRHQADDCFFDSDEVQVVAESSRHAIHAARKKWIATVGAKWPDLTLEKLWILTPARSGGLA